MATGVEQYRWTCACCGEEFVGLPMDGAFDVPVGWNSLGWLERLRSHRDDDFCKVRYSSGETDRFIRCIFPIPVPEMNSEFRFGVWISVSEDSWNIYEDGLNSGNYESDVCFGYLMHEIPGFEGSRLLHCSVEFQPDRQRPRIFLHETDHPLRAAQTDGISKAQVEAWVSMMHKPAH